MNPTYPDLTGKVAVVTGGSRGIGAAVCRALADAGAKVAVGGRDQDAIDGVVAQIEAAGGRAIGVPADVTDAHAVERMRERVEAELGPAHVLITCAGGHGHPTRTTQISEEEWHFVLDTNLTSTFLSVKSFLAGMVERRQGAIVTLSSAAGRLPSKASASYAAANAAIGMFSRHVAAEVGEHGVRVNCIAPSMILTERIAARVPQQQQQQVAGMFPLRRLGTPADIASAALFLASEQASWITGVTLDVAGGKIMM